MTLEKCIHHSNEHDDRPERHLALAHHLRVHDGGAGGVEHSEGDDPCDAEILVTHQQPETEAGQEGENTAVSV